MSNKEMQHYSIIIDAPVKKVWETMLEKDTYKEWANVFMEGSYYEGSWEKGEKIKFLAPGVGGMYSLVAENLPYEFLSLKHIGMIKDGKIDIESDEIKGWAPAFENYSFIEKHGKTELMIDLEVTKEWADEMAKSWPKALELLKQICERSLI